jgi:hypothetical protein
VKHRLWLMSAFLLLNVVWGGEVHQVQPDKVSPLVWQDLARGEVASVLVILTQQADVTSVTERQADAVYVALAAVAEETQPALTARLRQLGVPYRSFTLVNALALRADAALVRELAARSDVGSIVSDRAFAVALLAP